MYHKQAAAGKWKTLNISNQMANIGSEIVRTVNWRDKDKECARLAFERSLELLDLTISGVNDRYRLRELTRLRELWVDYFVGDNENKSSDEDFTDYFFNFTYAARANT